MRGRFGDPKGHAVAGRKGGKKSSHKNNPANFRNNPEAARKAGRKGGKTTSWRRQNLV